MTATATSTRSVSRNFASGLSTSPAAANVWPVSKLASETRLTRESVWFNGQPLAQIESASGAVHWYFNDHLGTPVLTTDATGAVDWRVEREPYGAIFATRAGAQRHQPLAFPGQEDGGELSYNIFRWYRAGWGRYTQADPIGLKAGGPDGIDHLYGYVLGNPTNRIDLYGLYSIHPNCDGFCGPPDEGSCFDKPYGQCFDPILNELKNKVFRDKQCRASIAANGVDWGAFARSLMRQPHPTGQPRISCDQSLCAGTVTGGAYYDATKTIPLCRKLFNRGGGWHSASQTMMHEFLHHLRVPEKTMEKVLLDCYPGMWPGTNH